MKPSKIFETPEASGFAEVEKTFVERMQEVAHKRAEKDYTGKMRVFHEDDLDTLTETIIHNTLAEVERVVEGEKKEEATFLREGDEMWDYSHIKARNRTLTTISAKLKEISK